jgi:hypothetical protein
MMKKLRSFATLLLAASFFGPGFEENTATAQPTGGTNLTLNAASRVIAVIPKLTNTVFWRAVLAGAKEVGKDFGHEIRRGGPDRENNNARQIQIVGDALAHQLDGVVIAPVDRTNLIPSVDKLSNLKVPCPLVDLAIETANFLSFASTDKRQLPANRETPPMTTPRTLISMSKAGGIVPVVNGGKASTADGGRARLALKAFPFQTASNSLPIADAAGGDPFSSIIPMISPGGWLGPHS